MKGPTPDYAGADGEGQVDRVCHEEQMTIWTGEIAGSLSMGGYLREDLSYDDNLDIHAVIAKDLRSIIGSALTHPALPAAPISPREREAIEAAGRALYMKNRGVPADAWDRDLPEGTRDHWRDYAKTALRAAGWPGPPAPCDGSGASRQDAQRLDPKDDSAVGEASSEVEAPAPSEIPTLKAEIERLTTALAESERKRVEAEAGLMTAITRLRDIAEGRAFQPRLHAMTGLTLIRLASTPTQEPPHVEV